jgi:hypothetical protein
MRRLFKAIGLERPLNRKDARIAKKISQGGFATLPVQSL